MQQTFQTALQYHQAGHLAQAESLYRQILRAQPGNAQVLHLLGLAAYQRGDYQAAIAEIGKAIAENPRQPDYYSNLGLALRAHGQPEQAVEAYHNGLQLAPLDADIHNNLGSALHALGRLDEAAASYRAALRMAPDNAAAQFNLGNVLFDQGAYDQAAECFRLALRFMPQDADIHNNLGNALRELGRFDEAMGCYREVLRLQPADAASHYNLGNALRELERFEEAVACYNQAIRLDPKDADTHNNLGNALRELGRLDEAIACYREAIRLDPLMHHAKAHLLHQCQHTCDWRDLDAMAREVRALVLEKPEAQISPFAMLAVPGTTSEEQRRCAVNWVAGQYDKHAAVRDKLGFSFGRDAGKKIRLGYLSADFHEHATAYLMAEVFELHDRSRFETVAYSYGPDDGSAMRARLKSAFGFRAGASGVEREGL